MLTIVSFSPLLKPFHISTTLDCVVGLAVVFSASLSLFFSEVVALASVPFYSPNLSDGRSSTLSTGFSKAKFMYFIS